MFWLIKKAFIGLLSFSGYLATKCMSLNNEQYRTSLTLIDLNPTELKYYPFMINLDKCNGSCNSVDDYLQKYVLRIKQKA